MAPTTIAIPLQRKLRGIGREVKAKSPTKQGSIESCKSISSNPDVDLDVLAQDCGPGHFEKTFNTRPEERDPAAVRLALEWWLRNLPISGLELAPELQAENWILFETFLCGRLTTCSRNQVIQEEGEEVKHYSIILFGQCKLRCAKPAVAVAPVVPALDNGKDDTKGREPDAFIHIETLGRGESIGMYPGDARSPYNVVCSDKTMILRLSAQDYDSTLRQYHKEFFKRTAEFLQQHNICPEASASQLKKIAPYLRVRRVPRGRIFIQGGEYQRHLYFLREGACSLLVHDSPDGGGGAGPLEEDEEDDEDQDGEDIHDKFLQRRASSYGARMQQSAAYDEHRNEVVKSMARGPMKQTLTGHRRHAFRVSDGNMQASATLSDPGLMLGEEAFVYDNFRDWVTLRNCYSVRAAKSCSFFVADISAFKMFVTYTALGSTEMAQMVNDKLNRRCKQFTRGQNATKRINKRAQEMKAAELSKFSRQQLRLPKCAGYPAVDELENLEDYLDVVMEHRKLPPNTQPPTLQILEGTGYGPMTANGPGVSALLKAVADDRNGILRRSRSCSRFDRDFRDGSPYEDNPLGGTVSADARYAETELPSFSEAPLAVKDAPSPKALPRIDSFPEVSTGWGGVFLNTEVNFEDGMTVSLETQTLRASTSLPNLPNLPVPKSVASKVEETTVVADTTFKAPRLDGQALAKKRHQRIMKSFNRVMPGKSVLILTDKTDYRKQITRVLLSDETLVSFIKTSSDLWQRLREGKESYDVLVIDMTKSELQIEPMLRAIRQQERYSQLPIVVLSLERELSEVVRNNCSFVVFLPLAAPMLREALVWCFDRKSAQKLYPSDKTEAPEEFQGLMKGKASIRDPNQVPADTSPLE